MKWRVGVDEAGRGPLAGPVAIGAVRVPSGFRVLKEFPGLRDSKMMTPRARERMFQRLKEYERAGKLQFVVRFSSANVIDKRGLTRAVANATARATRFLLPNPRKGEILLDGLLTAPAEYRQKTIIGGDESVPLIALASIAAKVLRDRRMKSLSKKYTGYGFEIHKGYGTALHYRSIKKLGPSEIHRKSFLRIDVRSPAR